MSGINRAELSVITGCVASYLAFGWFGVIQLRPSRAQCLVVSAVNDQCVEHINCKAKDIYCLHFILLLLPTVRHKERRRSAITHNGSNSDLLCEFRAITRWFSFSLIYDHFLSTVWLSTQLSITSGKCRLQFSEPNSSSWLLNQYWITTDPVQGWALDSTLKASIFQSIIQLREKGFHFSKRLRNIFFFITPGFDLLAKYCHIFSHRLCHRLIASLILR